MGDGGEVRGLYALLPSVKVIKALLKFVLLEESDT
jgi:hypothetical protein